MPFFYHYTTEEAWKEIQHSGLKTVEVKNPEVLAYFPQGVKGVFLWEKNPEGEYHSYALMYQLATKAKTRLVKLKVFVEPTNILFSEGRRVVIQITPTIQDWVIKSERMAAVISRCLIKPKDIKLVKVYDMVELLK